MPAPYPSTAVPVARPAVLAGRCQSPGTHSSLRGHPAAISHSSSVRGRGVRPLRYSSGGVIALLGKPASAEATRGRYAFPDGDVFVHVGPDDVNFLEFVVDLNRCGLEVELDRVNLSQLSAVECAAHLRELNGAGDIDESEAPSSFAYRALGLTVWQGHALVIDELSSARAAGASEEELEFLEDEVRLAHHFETIGLDSREYMEGYF